MNHPTPWLMNPTREDVPSRENQSAGNPDLLRRRPKKSLRSLMRLFFATAPLLALIVTRPVSAADPSYDFYVVPQFPASEISQAWSPLLARLSKTLGVSLVLKVSKSIPEFEQALLQGRPDIAFANPYHAVMAKKAAGYVPVIHDSDQQLSGILVVRKDSPVTSVKALEGAELAFPAPNAFGASLYMRALLKEKEHLNIVPRYVKTHSNVFRMVANGGAIAGGAIRQTLADEAPELQAQLRILYETPSSKPHPIVVHPRVPPHVRKALQQAFIQLGEEKDGPALLRPTTIASPRATSYADYAGLEQLGLDNYLVLTDK